MTKTEDGYFGRVLGDANCCSSGENYEEAIKNIRKGLELYLKYCKEVGKEPPKSLYVKGSRKIFLYTDSI